MESVTEGASSNYDLGYGFLGNGLTVWNRLETEHGDYKTIAHIDPDRTVKFYVKDLPKDIQEKIQKIAATTEMTISSTQNNPVFFTPPLEQIKSQKNPLVEPTTEEVSADTLIGREVTLEGRRFVVDSIDTTAGTASLRDMTFQNGAGFPIFRVEPVSRVREWLKPAEKEIPTPADATLTDRTAEMLQQALLANELSQQTGQMLFAFEEGRAEPLNAPAREKPVSPLPTPKPKPRIQASSVTIHPEIPDSQRQNFHITDDHLGEGGPKVKFQNNLAAIQTLQKIEAEERLATPKEQEILSRYVGWGGLPMAFDEQNGA